MTTNKSTKKNSSNQSKFMQDFYANLRDSLKEYKTMQKEIATAGSMLDKLRKEYEAVPGTINMIGTKAKKKAEYENFAKEIQDYFSGKDPNNYRWSLSNLGQLDAVNRQLKGVAAGNAIIDALRNLGIIPAESNTKTSPATGNTTSNEPKPVNVEELNKIAKENAANGNTKGMATDNSQETQNSWEGFLRDQGVVADEATTTNEPESVDEDVVEYTYKNGDTFGQVIKNLGLDEGNLWGDNGSVKYYTDQLWAEHPEVFDQRGNIKVGTTLKLRKRGSGAGTTVAPLVKNTPSGTNTTPQNGADAILVPNKPILAPQARVS